jgi:hypothetical protein
MYEGSSSDVPPCSAHTDRRYLCRSDASNNPFSERSFALPNCQDWFGQQAAESCRDPLSAHIDSVRMQHGRAYVRVGQVRLPRTHRHTAWSECDWYVFVRPRVISSAPGRYQKQMHFAGLISLLTYVPSLRSSVGPPRLSDRNIPAEWGNSRYHYKSRRLRCLR